MGAKTSTTELIKRSFIEMMKDIGTSIPGHIMSFNPETQLAQIQIGVESVDSKGEPFTPPPLIECPMYVYGGDYAVEVQIDPGTEGVVLFSQRCIDSWVDTGGVAVNPIMRFHDFSDAYFLPGIRSQVNRLTGMVNNGVRLRNKDGSNYLWLKNNGTAEFKMTTLTVIGDIDHTGDQTTSGTITGVTDVVAGTISGKSHVHGGVQGGSSTSGGPQ